MLRVTGMLLTRTDTPYSGNVEQGITAGIAYKARVETGRGVYEDIKIPVALLAGVPETKNIPYEGLPVDYAVEIRFGKVTLLGDYAQLAPARPSNGHKAA